MLLLFTFLLRQLPAQSPWPLLLLQCQIQGNSAAKQTVITAKGCFLYVNLLILLLVQPVSLLLDPLQEKVSHIGQAAAAYITIDIERNK